MDGRMLQAPRPIPILLNDFFGTAVLSVDHEYQVSKIVIIVYLPRQAEFEAHFSKILPFLPLEGNMDKLC